jgi:uncharacterized protein YjbJ (UPF0337 family)
MLPPIPGAASARSGHHIGIDPKIAGTSQPYTQSKETITMSLVDKIKNRLQMGKARTKQETGRMTRDRSMEAEGRSERMGSTAKQVGEHIKDVGKDIRHAFRK